MYVEVNDGHDYDKMKYKPLSKTKSLDELAKALKNNVIMPINNIAYEQQIKNKLDNYILSVPVNYTEEQINEILKSKDISKIQKLLDRLKKR